MFFRFDNPEHEAKATQVLSGLGEFVVVFEQVCAAMRSCIHCAFRRSGLNNQGLSQVIANPLAAKQLNETLGGLFAELRDQDKDDRKAVAQLLKRVDSLASIRNKFLHAEWFFNYDYEDNAEEFFALALKAHAKQTTGAEFLKIPVSRNTLDENIQEALEVSLLLRRLATCLNQGGLKVSTFLSRPL